MSKGDYLTTIDDIRVVMDREKSYGIANGAEEVFQGAKRAKVFFVPKALEGVEISEDGTSITLPTWKARELGLI